MAMNGDVLGMAIATVIATSAVPPADPNSIAPLWKKIAGEIVKHIQNNAVVPSGISLTTPNVGGTGSTTGTGRVT